MPDRDPRVWLADILREAEFLERAMAGVDLGAFQANEEKLRAVVQSLGIIGEAAGKLEAAQVQALSAAGIPVHKIRGMRNLLVHRYWRVEIPLVYEAASKDIGPLRQASAALLAQTPAPADPGRWPETGSQPAPATPAAGAASGRELVERWVEQASSREEGAERGPEPPGPDLAL